MKANTCPSCGAPIGSQMRNCGYCGRCLIVEKEDEYFKKDIFSPVPDTTSEQIVVCGRRLEVGEYPIHVSKANLYRGMMNAAGGHLVLTNNRFLFVDHGLNLNFSVKSEEESIYLSDVAGVEAKTVAFVSKRLIVKKRDGTYQEYVVWNLSEWMEIIQKAISHI